MSKEIKRSDFYRNFSLGLVYPAVLGSLIFQLLQSSSKNSTGVILTEFQLTVLTFIVVIYILDFLKCSLEKYSLMKVFFDLFSVFGLIFIYNSLNIGDSTISNINLINLSFAYMIFTGMQYVMYMTEKLFFSNKLEGEKYSNRVFEINNISTLNYLVGGTSFFILFHFAKNNDYTAWFITFVITSSVLIIADFIRLWKLILHSTIKD